MAPKSNGNQSCHTITLTDDVIQNLMLFENNNVHSANTSATNTNTTNTSATLSSSYLQ